MEAHPKCTFCFTNGKILSDKGMSEDFVPWGNEYKRKKIQTDFDAGELELLGYIPTASFLFPRQNNIPEIQKTAFQGDGFIKICLTNYGYAHFMPAAFVF